MTSRTKSAQRQLDQLSATEDRLLAAIGKAASQHQPGLRDALAKVRAAALKIDPLAAPALLSPEDRAMALIKRAQCSPRHYRR
jgi:hypothetical protein